MTDRLLNPLPNKGDRVRMIGVMPDDPDPIPVGSEGTVRAVHNIPSAAWIDVAWDSGRTLILLESDPYIIVRHPRGRP